MLISLTLHPLSGNLLTNRPIRSVMAESPFSLRFNHLPAGEHEFDYRIDDAFFKDREGSLIHAADVMVTAILHKSAGSMQLELNMSGMVSVECVRCLELFQLPLDIHRTLVVRMVEQPAAEEDDVDAITISRTAIAIDLEQAIYDFLTLEIPYSPVHPDHADGSEGCKASIPSPITKELSADREDNEKKNDRWAALKKIRLN